MKIEIYSKTDCTKCQQAKKFFRDNNLEYEEYIYDDEPERRVMYRVCSSIAGKKINTVPQIFIDSHYLGGYDNLMDVAFDIIEGTYG